jgi:hypothetical protein
VNPRRSLVLVGLVAIALLLVLPAPSAVTASHPGAPAGARAPAAPPLTGRAAPTPRGSHSPAVPTCLNVPSYGYIGSPGALPITPLQLYQGPCPFVSVDEVHGSFDSAVAGSGERWTIPVHLPANGPSAPQANAYYQFYLGMVVTGDPRSEWKQSYAAIVFTDAGNSGTGPQPKWTAGFHVFSLVNSTKYLGGFCSDLNFTWNQSYYCELDDLTNTSGPTLTFTAGDQLQATFAGATGGTGGLAMWLNDTTNTSRSGNITLNSATTGSYTFEPYYTTACADTCLLQWAMPMGLGWSFTFCPASSGPFATCDSYNETTWRGITPPEVGIPQYYTGGSYSGDFYYFAPSSGSAVCNTNAAPGLFAQCYNFDTLGGTGYYPYFTFNGTDLDFGANWTWTTEDFGGATVELLTTGAPNDIIPFFFYAVTNSSRGGFIPPSTGLTVATHLQDLGSIASASVTYQVNNGAPSTIPMTFANGTTSNANYTAVIPSGANGWVNYTVSATNGAGATKTTGAYHVQRGPLPKFSITTENALSNCGAGVRINGTLYANNAKASLTPGTYPILAHGCYPYVFTGWSLSKGLSVTPPGAVNGTLTVSASGTVGTNWVYVRPFDVIDVATNPTSCGSVTLNSTSYTDGQTASPLLDSGPYPLEFVGCAGKSFAGWTVQGNLSITGSNVQASLWYLDPHGNGTVTANFVDTSSAVGLTFYTTPQSCGDVLFQGAGYATGQSIYVLSGGYELAPEPCAHWGFTNFTTFGAIYPVQAPNGTFTVTVDGGGSITENNYLLTEVTFAVSPAGCGTVTWDGTVETPGTTIVVTNNSVHTVTASSCAGNYLFSITGTGGVHVVGNEATVNSSGTVTATSIPGTPTQFIAFLTDPAQCGSITFAGVRYVNSNWTNVATGTVATILATPCGGYGFLKWQATQGITIAGSTAYLNQSGAITAIFRPITTLFLYTSPTSCGSIEVGGVRYPTNSTVQLTEYRSYALAALPCPGYGFVNWLNTTGALISDNTLSLSTGAVLTAVFAPVRYEVKVLITPATCGGVRLAGQVVGNGTTLGLAAGSYTITPSPCAGQHLVNWSLVGNLTVTNTTLTVNGSGSVGALYQPVAPSVVLYLAESSLSGSPVPFGATVQVPVPPYTYSYTWSFGDGSTVTTPVNFTDHTYASPGAYDVKVTITDPYNRTASASGTIQVVAPSASEVAALSQGAVIGIALAIVAVAAIVILGSRTRRPPPEPDSLAAAAPAGDEPLPSPPPMEAPQP